MRIAILMTIFNRKVETQRILESINKQQQLLKNIEIIIFIIDGGSSDGSKEMIFEYFPNVNFEVRDGLYWNAGMREAWLLALPLDFDFYLLINNDVNIFNNTLTNLEDILLKTPDLREKIVVGSTLSVDKSETTYGPLRRFSKRSPIRFEINSNGKQSETVTFNANFVLIPKYVVELIGILSERFSHAFGDIDYGLRASKHGIAFFHLDFPVGICQNNSEWEKIQLGESGHSWKYLLSHPKGIPFFEWYAFCRNHGGYLWFLRFLNRYLKIAVNRVRYFLFENRF